MLLRNMTLTIYVKVKIIGGIAPNAQIITLYYKLYYKKISSLFEKSYSRFASAGYLVYPQFLIILRQVVLIK